MISTVTSASKRKRSAGAQEMLTHRNDVTDNPPRIRVETVPHTEYDPERPIVSRQIAMEEARVMYPSPPDNLVVRLREHPPLRRADDYGRLAVIAQEAADALEQLQRELSEERAFRLEWSKEVEREIAAWAANVKAANARLEQVTQALRGVLHVADIEGWYARHAQEIESAHDAMRAVMADRSTVGR